MINPATQHYLAELQTDPNVLGIILFGSWARGNNRPGSDVDLLVIVQAGFRRTAVSRAGQMFEVTYVTEQGTVDFWQANRDDAVELWHNAQVLFDRDGAVARLRRIADEQAAQGKPALTNDQYEHASFDVQDLLRAAAALSATDPVTARMLLSVKVFQLSELFFDIRQLWTPPPKQRLAVIKRLTPRLYELIARYYAAQPLAEQLDIARAITTIVFDQKNTVAYSNAPGNPS